MQKKSWLMCVMPVAWLVGPLAGAAEKQVMPKEDVVEVPAIGAGLCVANVFQSNMVLQRDKPLDIWGWAAPGEDVSVAIAGQEVRGKAADNRAWQVTLAPLPANSTPQDMVISGKTAKLKLENILVGDVWLLGGQSNMEFPISKVNDGRLEVVSANFPKIRLLTLPVGKGFGSVRSFERLHEWSDWSGRHFRKGDWDVCSPETVGEFSAIGYIFGRRIHMAANVPIGLIDASIGGTTVETWTPDEVLRKIEGKETRAMMQEWADKIAAYDPQADLQKRIENFQANKEKLEAKGQKMPSDLRPGPAADKNRPGCCYAGVIKPLNGLAIKGALFHQGFNNCFNGSAGARMYYQVFGKMITAWRATFNDPQMPFCIISLCTAGAPQTRENFLKPMYDVGSYIREAQYQTFRDFHAAGDAHVGFVSSFDLRKSFYHPQIKVPAGERAATWAMVTQYALITGRDAQQYWLPPAVKEAKPVAGAILLTMDQDITMKDDSSDKMEGFAIAGNDRRFYPADINWFTDGSKDSKNRPVYQRNVLSLSSPFVAEPVHYRYAWARNPNANLVNPQQVPIAAQRSDDWILEETPVKIPVPEGTTDDRRRNAQNLTRMLELDDLDRRVREAEATLAKLKPALEKARANAGNKNPAKKGG